MENSNEYSSWLKQAMDELDAMPAALADIFDPLPEQERARIHHEQAMARYEAKIKELQRQIGRRLL